MHTDHRYRIFEVFSKGVDLGLFNEAEILNLLEGLKISRELGVFSILVDKDRHASFVGG